MALALDCAAGLVLLGLSDVIPKATPDKGDKNSDGISVPGIPRPDGGPEEVQRIRLTILHPPFRDCLSEQLPQSDFAVQVFAANITKGWRWKRL